MVGTLLDDVCCHAQLQQALGEQLTKITLVHAFASLLKDPEAEVRAAASNRLRGMHCNTPVVGWVFTLSLSLSHTHTHRVFREPG